MDKDLGMSQEYAVLKQQHEDLREELARLAAEREMLLTTDKRSLEKEYFLKVGRKQYEMFMLRNDVLRFKRKIELIRACMNRGEEYDLNLIEKRLDEELRLWEEEARELVKNIRHAEYIDSLPLLSPGETRELKKIFRDLVRRLHPDLNPQTPENMQYIWNRVLAAYHNGDLQELKTLALLVEDGEPAGRELTALEELRSAINNTKERINHLLKDLARIEQQFPFKLRDKLDCDAWIRDQNEAMEKQIEQYREQKLVYLTLLEEFTANGGASLH